MKTRILSALAVLTALVAANLTGVTAANAATSDCYTYSVNGSNATITNGTACSGVVVVPSTLDGYTVTALGVDAFTDDNDITSITLPDSITDAAVLAFNKATALETITFGSGLTYLSQGILGDNPSLTTVNLPSSLQRIDAWAFFNCQSLQSITIPASVTSIDHQAFETNASLTAVTFEAGSKIQSIGENAFHGTNVNLGAPSRSGSSFVGWNTASDGSGDSYVGSALNAYLAAGSGTIYSQWSVSLTYDGNGSLSGPAPVDRATYLYGASATIRDQWRLLDKPGYKFTGWNSKADGTGRPATPGALFIMLDEPVVLYAQWATVGSSFSYNGNESDGGLLPSFAISPLVSGTHVVVQRNSGTLTKNGFTFTGWNTAADGTGTAYAPGAIFDMPETAVVLYAQWQLTPVKAAWTVAPSVSGNAKATARGTFKLSANPGVWAGTPTPTASLQWYSCTAKVAAATSVIPKSCKVIRGATSATLALKSAQKKKFIAVAVTGQSAGTASTTVLSKSTGKVK